MSGDDSPKREFQLKINSYGSFPVTRPSTLPLAEEKEEAKGCWSAFLAKLMGRRRAQSDGDEGREDEDEESGLQLDPHASWKNYITWWIRVDKWSHEVSE
jgi:hypothetical protein